MDTSVITNPTAKKLLMLYSLLMQKHGLHYLPPMRSYMTTGVK